MPDPAVVPIPIISYDEDPFNLVYSDVFRMSYCATTFSLEHSVQLPHEENEDIQISIYWTYYYESSIS